MGLLPANPIFIYICKMTERTATIQELQQFFNERKLGLPKEIQLGQAVRIIDVPKFIENHISVLQQPDLKGTNDVFLLRLLKLKEVIESGNI